MKIEKKRIENALKKDPSSARNEAKKEPFSTPPDKSMRPGHDPDTGSGPSRGAERFRAFLAYLKGSMMKRVKKQLTIVLLILGTAPLLFFMDTGAPERSGPSAETLYEELRPAEGTEKPPYDLFRKGCSGFRKASNEGALSKRMLTLIDLRLSSNKKRLWTIDLDSNKVRMQTLVAHGKGSGNEFAREFSNKPGSHKSSLGLYATGETYRGKHGLSLRLDGLEEGFNANARERAIVMHGAGYVSKSFAERHGRIGRSFGCPSVPLDVHKPLIRSIQGKSGLFIYYPKKAYLKGSEYLLDGAS